MELPLLSLYSLWRSERIYQLFLDRNLKVLQIQLEYSRAYASWNYSPVVENLNKP